MDRLHSEEESMDKKKSGVLLHLLVGGSSIAYPPAHKKEGLGTRLASKLPPPPPQQNETLMSHHAIIKLYLSQFSFLVPECVSYTFWHQERKKWLNFEHLYHLIMYTATHQKV